MCGICGKFNYNDIRPVDAATIEGMTSILEHRGPDGSGVFIDGNVGLGHRRLSIIDLSPRGRQPMFNEDGTIALVFNGEIYNYREMAVDLKTRGHAFRSDTDTEVIIHAYEEYGAACVTRFNGMFAFAVWDGRKEELLLARDRLGVKPLYYHLNGRAITFASEIKSLLVDPEIPSEVDPQALGNFLTLHYVPGPRTMFRDIQKLQPGHTITVSGRGVAINRYWELDKDPEARHRFDWQTETVVAGTIYTELRESVRKRMQSDVAVGALLSGGLDSSAILGLMTGLKGGPVPSFTVGYSPEGDDPISEFKYSRAVASHFKSDNHEVVVDAQSFLYFLPTAIWHQDEPIGEPASIPLYYASKLARDNGVTVLLTGEGSDELFAGYNRHWGEILSKYYRLMPGTVRDGLAGRLIRSLSGSPLLKKGHRAMSIRDFRERYMSWHTVFTEEQKKSLLKGREGLLDTYADVFKGRFGKTEGLGNLDSLLLLDINVWLPDDLLMKKDKMGMATSIEARVPFLDYTFVEMAFQLPQRLKVHRLTTKYILKKSMERLLPKEIIYRKKEGFPTPVSGWLRNELRDFTLDILCAGDSFAHGFFNRKEIEKLLIPHLSGTEDNGRMLFPLINFEIWHSLFIRERRNLCRIKKEASAPAANI